MSKVKIYDGVTFDMSTGAVLDYGTISYQNEGDITNLGGGGKSSTTTSGFAKEYKPEITEMLGEAKNLYDNGELGQVAGLTDMQKRLFEGEDGVANQTASKQLAMEQALVDQANKGVDLSGAKAAALQGAQQQLGSAAGAAGAAGGLGGGRAALNNASIKQNYAAQTMGIDQQEQAMNFANKQGALASLGKGAQTLGAAGAAEQQFNQNQVDSGYKALAQRVGLFSGMAPKSSTTEQTGGK